MSKNGDHVFGKESNKSIWFKGGNISVNNKLHYQQLLGMMVYNMESGEVNELLACIFSCGTIIWYKNFNLYYCINESTNIVRIYS